MHPHRLSLEPKKDAVVRSTLLCSAALNCLASLSVGVAAVQAQPVDISSTVDIDANAGFEIREETYTLPEAQLPSRPEDVPPDILRPEMVGLVVSPVDAIGPRPVALFIHGANSTCYDPAEDRLYGMWPCPDGYEAVPSYRGFLANQRFLAARGWVTVSVSVNGVNGTMLAGEHRMDSALRSEMAEEHLRQWARWLAGEETFPAPEFITNGVQPDLQQLLVVGHSRGGSAANEVALKSAANASLPWRVRAQVLIGPSASHFNPPPALPTVVLLPGCDGDVFALQGQGYIDRGRDLQANRALRSAVLIHGANHNFFNSEWDPTTAAILAASDDDALGTFFRDSALEGACAPDAEERLSGEAQRELGSFYIAAAGKAFMQGDASILPLFDGSPVCAGPTCRTNIQTHALGGGRQPLLVPSVDTGLMTSEQVSMTPCFTGGDVGAEGACITTDMPTFYGVARTPHFLPERLFEEDVTQTSERVALHMQWNTVAGAARIDASEPALRAGATDVALRVIVPPGAVGTTFALSLIDSAGSSLPLGAAELSGVPTNAGARTGVYWAQEVRFPIDLAAAAAAGFEVDAIQSLEITSQSSSGSLWLLDAWSYAPGA